MKLSFLLPKILFAVGELGFIGYLIYVIEQLSFVLAVIALISGGIKWHQQGPHEAKNALGAAVFCAASYTLASYFFTKCGMPVPQFSQ
jgi:hypothetical protein